MPPPDLTFYLVDDELSVKVESNAAARGERPFSVKARRDPGRGDICLYQQRAALNRQSTSPDLSGHVM